jgi:hypothetical protein
MAQSIYGQAGLSMLDDCVCIFLHECIYVVGDERAKEKDQDKEENEIEVKGGKKNEKRNYVVLFLFNHHISPGNLFSCFGMKEVMQGVQKEMQPIEVTNTESVQNNYHYFTILWFHNSDFLLSHPNKYYHV